MNNFSLNNLKNLSLLNNTIQLIGGASYSKCKADTMRKTMKEYKEGDLKDRAGESVEKREQAIAIGLSKVEDQCKRAPKEVDALIEKVKEDLNNVDKPLNLTNVIETKDALEKLVKKGGKSKKLVYVFKKLLWSKIIKAGRNGEKLDTNMWDEIKHIHEL